MKQLFMKMAVYLSPFSLSGCYMWSDFNGDKESILIASLIVTTVVGVIGSFVCMGDPGETAIGVTVVSVILALILLA